MSLIDWLKKPKTDSSEERMCDDEFIIEQKIEFYGYKIKQEENGVE